MRVYVQVSDDRVINACYQTYGCVPAIAAGSLITDWSRGRTVAEVVSYTAAELTDALGGLPPERRFCAALAVDAMRAAVAGAGTVVAGGPG